MIFMIFLGADMMNAALALSQMPAQLAQAVAASALPPLAVVVGILAFYVVLGCVMDELSMILLTVPILFPAVMGLDLFGLDAIAESDLVRHSRAVCRRGRPDRPAGGAQRVRGEQLRARRADGRDLPWRAAISSGRCSAYRAADTVPAAEPVAGRGARAVRQERSSAT